jgi:hypothetical protein
MRKIILAVLLLASSAAYAGDEAGPVGTWKLTKPGFDFPACKSIDDLDRFVKLMSSGDADAAASFVNKGFATDQCIRIVERSEVRVEEYSILHGAFCVRPRGETSCYWVPQFVVDNQATQR